MKKTIVCILAALLTAATALTFTGCGEEEESSAVNRRVSTADSAATTAATDATAATAASSTAATTKPTVAATTKAPATTAPKTTTASGSSNSGSSTNNNSNSNNSSNNNANNNSNNNTNNNSNNNNNNNNNQNSAQPQPTTKAAGSFSAADTNFVYNGSSIALNSDMNSVLAKLGNANEVTSQQSCHGVGEDKTYVYNGFTVNTYPLDNTDRVLEVVVSSADIATSKGVHVGSSEADVIAAYGNGYHSVGMYYSYETNDGKSVQFLMENGTVAEISYYYDV